METILITSSTNVSLGESLLWLAGILLVCLILAYIIGKAIEKKNEEWANSRHNREVQAVQNMMPFLVRKLSEMSYEERKRKIEEVIALESVYGMCGKSLPSYDPNYYETI